MKYNQDDIVWRTATHPVGPDCFVVSDVVVDGYVFICQIRREDVALAAGRVDLLMRLSGPCEHATTSNLHSTEVAAAEAGVKVFREQEMYAIGMRAHMEAMLDRVLAREGGDQ